MAIVKSGPDRSLLVVDPTSKAIRTTPYKTPGVTLDPEPLATYLARIEVIPTTVTAGSVYWTLRNSGPRSVLLRKLEVIMGFAGTAAATRSLYDLKRFHGGGIVTGTPITPIPKDMATKGTTVVDIRYAPAGMTVTGLMIDQPIITFGVTNQLSFQQAVDYDFAIDPQGRIILLPGDGVCIAAYGAVVAGSYIIGSIAWEEVALG